MDIFNKFNPQKIVFVFNFNWAAIISFVFFWSYGFFGALTGKGFGFIKSSIISIFLCVIFIFFVNLWQKNDLFKDRFAIKNKDIIVFASFLIIMFFLSFSVINSSLVGDQLAHSQQSKLHSITFVYLLSQTTDFFDGFNFSNLIYIIDLLTIIVGIFIYKFIRKKNFLFQLFVFLSIFIFFRIIIINFGGMGGPHPPFRLFPLWFSSAIFSSSDFSFRLAQFIGLIGMMWLVQRFANKHLNFVNSWFFALTVGTIPVLWHVGVLPEQSIWTAISWILFLFYFFDAEEGKFNYIRWISIISVFTLMRQSAFVALIPIFLILGLESYKEYRKKKLDHKKVFFMITPIFAMLPFLLNSMINGTSASYLGGITYNIPEKSSVFYRIWAAIDSGILYNSIINSIRLPWLLFILISLFLIYKKPFKVVSVITFFISSIFVFYMINPSLWGMGRYQAEYAAPFVVIGFFYFFNFIYRQHKFIPKILPFLALPLIIYNIFVFKNLNIYNKPVEELYPIFTDVIKEKGNYAILSEFPLEYKQAFNEAKKSGYAGKIFVAGSTYGVFGEILNNFSVSEIISERNIYDSINNAPSGIFSSRAINNNKNIQMVIISDYFKKGDLEEELENFGWMEWKVFKNEKYNSIISGFIRDSGKSKF